MKNLTFPWFFWPWQQWQAGANRRSHAVLVSAPPGIGGFEFALFMAQATLCESGNPGERPCGSCAACGWFEASNHPDCRIVVPESMAPETPSDGEAGETEDGPIAARGAPSKVIKIGQVRALDSFFSVGTHRGGTRVAVIYPCETLTVESANRLLKTLEEPAPDTLIVCVTHRLDAVLPTLRSRCARVDLPLPEVASAVVWLAGQGVDNASDALAEAGGAPLLALEQQGSADFRQALVAGLANPGRLDPVALAERCEKGGAEAVCLWTSRWLSDLLLCGNGGKVRYHPREAQSIERIARSVPATALDGLLRRVVSRRRTAEHPLNVRLFLEEIFIDYARVTAR
ncbi:MAG: DNA polymerase III subunit delta' C-terminal domain-containing protein [Burkholderiales bacterium]